jgi:hypothetical protein
MGAEPALWRVPQRLEKASILRGPLGEVVEWNFSGYFFVPEGSSYRSDDKTVWPSYVAIDKRVTRPTG